MQLIDLGGRTIPPAPWQEGDNLPWHDPVFSARMLREHLSQEHDAASRRTATIERQVAWIDQDVLGGRPTAILDLGCGPGLYTARLARRGHTCVGIDFSPAAIAYATTQAESAGLACRYLQGDLRDVPFGTGFGLVMLIFGELNVFSRADAARLLTKAHAALADDGLLLLEPHPFAVIERKGQSPRSWYTAERGLFGDAPYLCLSEHFWEPTTGVATTRYFVVELATGAVTRYAQSFQGYTEVAYRDLLHACGFTDIRVLPSLTGDETPDQPDLCAIVARKRHA